MGGDTDTVGAVAGQIACPLLDVNEVLTVFQQLGRTLGQMNHTSIQRWTDQLNCSDVFCTYDPIVVRFWWICGPSLRQDEFSGNPDGIHTSMRFGSGHSISPP